MTTDKIECASCRKKIDAAAKLCVFCGANPETGKRVDTAPLIEETFKRKKDLPASESVLEFMRQRQTIVVSLVIAAIFLLAFALHQFIRTRNDTAVSDVPGIPLTEIADLSNREKKTEELPLPELEFQYEGSARTMRTLLVEPGAVAPPAPVPPGTPPQATRPGQPQQPTTARPTVAPPPNTPPRAPAGVTRQ